MRKLTYEEVKQYIESFGYTLLSEEYINNRTPLKMICPESHITETITYSNFKKGYRCLECGKIKAHDKQRFSYEEVKEYIESFNYKLLSTEYKNARTNLIIQCDKGHIYEATFTSFKHKHERCPYCSHKGNKIYYFDSLGFLYHDIAKMIVEDKRNELTWVDTYSIAPKSNKSFYFKCNKCGHKSKTKKQLSSIQTCGFSCENCSDGVSIPEKILREINKQFKLSWNFEVKILINDKKYIRDCYDKENKIIIEMDGCFGNHNKEYHNERDRDFLAIGEYTIRIDLTNKNEYIKNTFEYIKHQILNSNLPNYLYYVYNIDINNLNWDLIWKNSQNSLCVQAWEKWNNGIEVKDIAETLNLSKVTVRTYLKRGNKCGVCSYTKYKKNK